MEFNVAQLLKEVTGAVRRYQLSESLEGIDPELVPLEPMTGELRLMRTNSGILASGVSNRLPIRSRLNWKRAFGRCSR
jgi:hypothetical protein